MLNCNVNKPRQCGGIVEGDKVRRLDVMSNSEWHKLGHLHRYGSETVTYESNDGMLTVTFDDECDYAIVQRVTKDEKKDSRMSVGSKVHIDEVLNAGWMLTSAHSINGKTSLSMISPDKTLGVTFSDSEFGVIQKTERRYGK